MSAKIYNITQEFVAACQILDVDPKRVILQMGLPLDSLENHGLSLSAGQVAMVFGLIVVEYGHDDFHIRLADGFARAAFGHAFLALQCSETLRKGIHRLAHFKRLIEPVDWIISESEGKFRIELRSLSSDFPLVGVGQIMSFLWLVQCCRNITARDIKPAKVLITDQVPHQAEIEKAIGCPITVANTALLEFPSDLMDLPVLSFNSYISSLMDANGSSPSPLSGKTDHFIASVYSVMQDLLPSGAVNLERVAAKLTISKRTLERRLKENGLSFMEILRECRMSMAQHYLKETHMPIAEISLLLGYRETNSFYRAFKECHGYTPQQVRA